MPNKKQNGDSLIVCFEPSAEMSTIGLFASSVSASKGDIRGRS